MNADKRRLKTTIRVPLDIALTASSYQQLSMQRAESQCEGANLEREKGPKVGYAGR